MDTNKLFSNKWARYGLVSFIGWVFMAFVVGWVFMIPVAVVVFLAYGYVVYTRERKHRIAVAIKPTEAMKALVRREAELKREKERILHEEFRSEIKQ